MTDYVCKYRLIKFKLLVKEFTQKEGSNSWRLFHQQSQVYMDFLFHCDSFRLNFLANGCEVCSLTGILRNMQPYGFAEFYLKA